MRNAVEQAHQHRQLESYGAALEAGLPQKLTVIEPWLRSWRAGDIVDIGAGTGALSARQAYLHPESSIIGVDAAAPMVDSARKRYSGYQNLEFRKGDACHVHAQKASSVIFCSVLHEVYSHYGDSLTAVEKALQAAWQSVLPGGRVVIRDFVIPDNGNRPVLLYHHCSDIVPGHDFLSFSRTFPRPLYVQSVRVTPHTIIYETDLVSACEYLLRKDYHAMWDVELQERYGFWTIAEAHHLIQSIGFVIVHSEMLRNSWVLRASLRGKVKLREPCSLLPLRFPACQLLLVAEKPQRPS
jgi:SAM-dependent methyltransferase